MTPPKLKGHSLVQTDFGLLLFGGVSYPDVDMTISDAIRAKRKEYEELCKREVERIIERQQKYVKSLPTLTINDIGSKWWNYMYRRTGNECFNVAKYPPFPKDTRQLTINTDIYVLPIDSCYQDCNGNGGCSLGRCTCKNGYYGEACEFNNCHNSLVFVDVDTIN